MRLKITNRENLLKAIKEHHIISFDIFDTLITRKTLRPEDVFEIVEWKLNNRFPGLDFTANRKKAILENKVPNPNIYQIYEAFAELTGISQKDAKQILELELAVEKTVLIRRDTMAEILNDAKQMGKRVCLITDMYLPSHVIADILTGLKICQYDDILVSCDYRTLKGEELFDRYKEKYVSDSYLHIGDNLFSDIECSEKRGIDCIAVESGITMFRKSLYGTVEKNAQTLTERNLLGAFVAKMYNDPFIHMQREGMKLEEISEMFINPLVYCMLEDIKRIVSESHYDKVLFASRDGYLLKQLYDSMYGETATDGIYFYTSRKAVTNLFLEEDEQILWLANLPFGYNKEEILSKVFKVDRNNYDTAKEYNENILLARDEIKKRSAELRAQYRKYIQKIGLTTEHGKYLFVDLVSSGTCQMYLLDLLDGDIEGYYLCKLQTNEERKERLKYVSLFDNIEINNKKYGFYKMYHLIESVLTSHEPSLDFFDEIGNPVFMEETRDESEIQRLKKIHGRMKKYYQDMRYMCNGKEYGGHLLIDQLITIFLEINEADKDFRINLKDDWMNVDKVINQYSE